MADLTTKAASNENSDSNGNNDVSDKKRHSKKKNNLSKEREDLLSKIKDDTRNVKKRRRRPRRRKPKQNNNLDSNAKASKNENENVKSNEKKQIVDNEKTYNEIDSSDFHSKTHNAEIDESPIKEQTEAEKVHIEDQVGESQIKKEMEVEEPAHNMFAVDNFADDDESNQHDEISSLEKSSLSLDEESTKMQEPEGAVAQQYTEPTEPAPTLGEEPTEAQAPEEAVAQQYTEPTEPAPTLGEEPTEAQAPEETVAQQYTEPTEPAPTLGEEPTEAQAPEETVSQQYTAPTEPAPTLGEEPTGQVQEKENNEILLSNEETDVQPVIVGKLYDDKEETVSENTSDLYAKKEKDIQDKGDFEVVDGGDVTEQGAEVSGDEHIDNTAEGMSYPHEQKGVVNEKIESETAQLDEKESFADTLEKVFKQVAPILGNVFNPRIIGTCLFLVVLVVGGWWGLSNNIHQSLFVLFSSDGEQEIEFEDGREYESSDNNLLEEMGLKTAMIFGANQGSQSGLVPVQIRVADFFGKLKEPNIGGETGISAATYYGSLMDEREQINQFVEYMRELEDIHNLYSIDVYAMLDQTTERDESLLEYLDNLVEVREDSKRTLAAININIDDLRESYESISGDKETYETDFFVAMEDLKSEKSDVLLKSFIDVSQKQVALKARVAALNKLVSYYETAQKKLDRRIESIDKNKAALIQGIHVTDVPGAGIDIIVRPE